METIKICPKCDKEFNLGDRKSRTTYCPPCNAEWCRDYRRKKREGISTAPKPYVMPDSRVCRICEKEKPIAEFNFCRKDRGIRSSYCKPCQHKIGNAWRVGNRRRKNDCDNCSRATVTTKWYYEQLAKQEHLCAICQTPEIHPITKGGAPRQLAIDHDHESGTIRGLLCFRCNTSLHQLEKHGLGWADAAVAYLKKYQETKCSHSSHSSTA